MFAYEAVVEEEDAHIEQYGGYGTGCGGRYPGYEGRLGGYPGDSGNPRYGGTLATADTQATMGVAIDMAPAMVVGVEAMDAAPTDTDVVAIGGAIVACKPSSRPSPKHK
ncbi:hypothetical protein AMTR_s00090p00147560 [Amborella trichopoda]|uniref:Uncharacterized protein n=1 Tax=Amborella trichopoda TaxID=13333 RepID=W1P417_AMBTC|nr:hypothetical protein AMTR_s00090p00147560 [Amborella trichopoda]